jgi:hypothetical protein
MDISIPRATAAIEEFLLQVDVYDQDAIDNCNDLLISIWYIENAEIRSQIIQTAAIRAGWLAED